MINNFAFNDDHIFSVNVSHDTLGEIGLGSLTFGPKQAISLKFGHGVFEKLEQGKKYDRLIATVQKGREFTLFNCELHFNVVYADFIVAGNSTDTFDLAEIELTHVTNWFFQFQRISGDVGTSIEWIDRPSNVTAEVKSLLGDYSLAITPYTDLIATDDGNQIRNTAVISIENTQFNLTVRNLRSNINDLCTLFSILLAQPVSIISVRVRNKIGRSFALYFTHYEKIEDNDNRLDSRMRYLFQRDLLEANWQTIAQSFFNSDLRDPSWLRLSSMKRYQDFWEYEVAAYVFILDSYVDAKTKSLPKKTKNSSTNKIEKLKARLQTSSSTFTQQQKDELIALTTEIFGSKEHSFLDKYLHVVSQVDKDVIKIINLKDDDFKYLKRFRDDVAHGHPLNVDGSLSSNIPQLTDRLSLLLTYFAFLDFGLTSQDFIGCMSQTWNQIVRNSEINQLHLDRVSEMAEFIAVSAETLELFKQQTKTKHFPCFVVTPGAEPIFSEHYTDLYYKQLFIKKSSHALEELHDIFQLTDKKVRSVGKLYFEHGNEHLQLNQAFLFG